MSENIQSISQGTYTIGQTSATNFVAGPGIKIDQPSVGTVRIGNDKTVLWSGNCLTQGAASVSLSESASNFEKIEIYAIPNPSDSYNFPQVFTYPGSNTKGAYICPFMTTSLKGKFSVGIWTITNGTALNLEAAAQTDSYPTYNWNDSYGGIIKVIGINRISGGNE